METRVYYPETAEKQGIIDEAAARLHAEHIVRCIMNLPCPADQKRRILKETAETITLLAGEKKREIHAKCTDLPREL